MTKKYICKKEKKVENFQMMNSPVLMGLNQSGDIYYANQNTTTNPNWTKIPGNLINISYSNKQAFGIAKDLSLYYNSDYTSGNWVKIHVGLTSISFDGYNMIIMGVNLLGDIYYANQNITTNPNWTKIPGKLMYISYSNKQACGTNIDGSLYYSSNYTSGNWVNIPGYQSGKMSGVILDGYNMILIGCVSLQGLFNVRIVYADQNITTNPNWKAINVIDKTIFPLSLGYINKQLFINSITGFNSAPTKISYLSDYTTNNFQTITENTIPFGVIVADTVSSGNQLTTFFTTPSSNPGDALGKLFSIICSLCCLCCLCCCCLTFMLLFKKNKNNNYIDDD